MLQKLLWLALAGALGTLTRYALAEIIQKYHGGNFPLGSIAVNLAGCAVAGFLWALFEHKWPGSAEIRIFVLVGFLGAFTTFSAFMLETGELLRSTGWTYAAIMIMVQNVLGLAASLAGVAIGRQV